MRRMVLWIVCGLSFVLSVGNCLAGEAVKPITLKYADGIPESSWFGKHHKWWANEVEKRSGGRIKVQIFWMESLVKFRDMLPGIQSGMTDLGWLNATYHPSNLRNMIILDNPGNFGQNYAAALLAIIDAMENEPTLRGEMERENIVLLSSHISGISQIAAKKCFDSIKGIKGQTIRTYGGGRTKYLEYLGANPVFLSYAEIYEAMDRGTISAFEAAMNMSVAFKHHEVVKCMYMQNVGGALAGGTFINRKLFNTFPGDLQKMFVDLRHEYAIRYAQDLMDVEGNYYREWETKYGIKMKNPSTEDQKIITDACKRAQDYMVKTQESQGAPGVQKLWDYYLATLRKYETQGTKKQ